MPSRAWLAQIADSALDAIVCFDGSRVVQFCNRAAATLFGLPAEEVVGAPASRFIDALPVELQHPRRHRARALHRDGTGAGVEISLSPCEGAQEVWVAVLRPLDAREQLWADLEERLRENELLHQAFDSGPAVMAIGSMEGKVVHVNQAFADRLGYQRDELIGRAVRELRWDPAESEDLFEKLRAAGHLTAPRHLMKKKDGSRIELAASWQMLPFRGAMHVLFMALDITAERAATEAAREVERRFSEIAGSIKEVFWMTALDAHQMLYVSPAYEKIWGRSCESLLKDSTQWVEAIHPEDQARVRAANAVILTQGYDVQYRVVRPDGSLRWVHDRSFVVRNPAGEPTAIGGVAEDITERRELEQRFHQAQKLESVGRLAGGVAHDFNNLLTVISASTNFLLEELGDRDPEYAGLGREVRHAIERGTALTRQLLAFSRQQVVEPKVLDVNKVLGEAEKMLRRLIGEDVELITRLQGGLPNVKVDPGQLTQVMMNLCVNARDAMPTGGRLVIETCAVELDPAHARAHLGAHAGHHVRVSVTDTGEGMSQEVQARIFEPFFTTKPAGKGTGLGLAVVFGAVQQAGGHVEVVSARGAGATFHVYLPATTEAAPDQEEEAPRLVRGGEAVLLVEDDAAVRRLSSRTLRTAGFVVHEATDGEEALQLIRQTATRVDLIVTDVVMPGLSGRQLSEAAQAVRPGLKVLFVSGYTDDAVVRHGVMREEVAFLNKPFVPQTLLKKVREVLDAKSAQVIPIARAAHRQL
ncbi:MAG: PAS domain S-box protein [Myxococcaceae bacterium]